MEGFFEPTKALVEGLSNFFGVMRLIGGELAEEEEREVWAGINRWTGELR